MTLWPKAGQGSVSLRPRMDRDHCSRDPRQGRDQYPHTSLSTGRAGINIPIPPCPQAGQGSVPHVFRQGRDPCPHVPRKDKDQCPHVPRRGRDLCPHVPRKDRDLRPHVPMSPGRTGIDIPTVMRQDRDPCPHVPRQNRDHYSHCDESGQGSVSVSRAGQGSVSPYPLEGQG